MKADLTRLTASRSGHCRMELWLDAHGYEAEPFKPGAERTMDYGSLLEYLLFDGVEVEDHHSEGGKKRIGGWWKQELELVDPLTKYRLVPSKMPIRDSQRLVTVEGFTGRIDRLADVMTADLLSSLDDYAKNPVTLGERTTVLLDSKSCNDFTFMRMAKGEDLLDDTFIREHVFQQQFLMKGLRDQGENVVLAALIFINKVQSKMLVRFIPWNAQLAAQAVDRLKAGAKDAEPEPDWPMPENAKLELRCTYCSQKQNCATMRNLKLEMTFTKKGAPEWTAKRL